MYVFFRCLFEWEGLPGLFQISFTTGKMSPVRFWFKIIRDEKVGLFRISRWKFREYFSTFKISISREIIQNIFKEFETIAEYQQFAWIAVRGLYKFTAVVNKSRPNRWIWNNPLNVAGSQYTLSGSKPSYLMLKQSYRLYSVVSRLSWTVWIIFSIFLMDLRWLPRIFTTDLH